jgi:hypothetical protein
MGNKKRGIDLILHRSLISQIHNGGEEWREKGISKEKESLDFESQDNTNGQKWWLAVIFGLIFFIVASPSFVKLTSKIAKNLLLPKTYLSGGITFFGLFLHMLIFIFIVRFILY